MGREKRIPRGFRGGKVKAVLLWWLPDVVESMLAGDRADGRCPLVVHQHHGTGALVAHPHDATDLWCLGHRFEQDRVPLAAERRRSAGIEQIGGIARATGR